MQADALLIFAKPRDITRVQRPTPLPCRDCRRLPERSHQRGRCNIAHRPRFGPIGSKSFVAVDDDLRLCAERAKQPRSQHARVYAADRQASTDHYAPTERSDALFHRRYWQTVPGARNTWE